MIEVKQLCAAYGKKEILHDLSLSFEKGRLTSVIGVNGCGKSTLLKAILRMLPLCSGEIRIDGRLITELPRDALARKVACLPQGRATPDMTVQQLVLHGRFPHLKYPRRYGQRDYAIAGSAMEQVGVAEYAHRPLRALSGGMRQNAYIAMALAQGTEYILLDEPTSYLDIAHQLELMKLLRGLADEGKGIVSVLHDLPMALRFSDRIILLHAGRLLCQAAPEAFREGELLKQIFGVELCYSAETQSYSYRY
ncbi:MAG: ABC transporter ATP-binding protein [Bacillota bacterium]|nr:ABC transporter ATP-binding protein [Bacillota bacterium]